MSDAEIALVRRARTGDRAAFDELVRRTSRLVYARLYLETGDPHRAEDLLQDALLRAYRSVHRLSDPSGFRPWLLTIAQNVMYDATRRDTRLKRTPSEPPAAGEGEPADRAAEREELRQRVLAVLRSLPDEYRLPLSLRYLADADYETISTQLGLTNGSLRGLLHRGLKMLRDRLPADFGAELGG